MCKSSCDHQNLRLSDECAGVQVLVCMVLHSASCGTNTQLCKVSFHLVPHSPMGVPHSPHLTTALSITWLFQLEQHGSLQPLCLLLTSSADQFCMCSVFFSEVLIRFFTYVLFILYVCLFSLPLNLENCLHIWTQVLCQM